MLKYILLTTAIILTACNEGNPKKEVQKPVSTVQTNKTIVTTPSVIQNTVEETLLNYKSEAADYLKQSKRKRAGITYLNIAKLYDEGFNQLDSALVYTDSALAISQQVKDDLQIAHLYKYKGSINNKQQDYKAAQSNIKQAINFYKKKNYLRGVASAQHDLAQVYLNEGNYNQSEKQLSQALDFWKVKEDVRRIYSVNGLGVELYHKMGNLEKMNQLIDQNRELAKGEEIHSFMKNKFELVLRKLAVE